jgi:hypothetical protein
MTWPIGRAIDAAPCNSEHDGVDDSQAAIALAVRWLSAEASIAYTADAGSCWAESLAGTWTVTCRAMLAGCSEAIACQRTIRLHVSLNPRRGSG